MKKNDVKPYLTSVEKKRYTIASEHFIRGTSQFFVNYNDELKKIIDFQVIKDEINERYQEIVNCYKEKLTQQVEQIKSNASVFLSKVFDVLLIGGILAYGIIKHFDIDVSAIMTKLGSYAIQLKSLCVNDSFEKTCSFFGLDHSQLISQIKDGVSDVAVCLWHGIEYILSAIDNFLNGEVFTRGENIFHFMIREAAIFAYNRALSSPIGNIFGQFLGKIRYHSLNKPNIMAFVHYGPDAFKEIVETEQNMQNIFSDEKNWGAYEMTNSGGKFIHVDDKDFKQFVAKHHQNYMRAAIKMAQASSVDGLEGVFSDISNPFDTNYYIIVRQELIRDLDERIATNEWFNGRDLGEIIYRDEKIDKIYDKVDKFVNQNTDDRFVLDIREQWKAIHKGVGKNVLSGRPLITFRMALELMVMSHVVDMYSIHKKIRDYTFDDIESHIFQVESKLDKNYKKIKKINRENKVDDISRQFYSLNELIVQLKTFDNTNVSFDYMYDSSILSLNSGYVFANELKMIRDQIQRKIYINSGFKKENIYFFNNYSEYTDKIHTQHVIDNEGKTVSKEITDKQVQNKTTTEELTIIVVEEYIRFKNGMLKHRKIRHNLIEILIQQIERLKGYKEKYENSIEKKNNNSTE